MFRSFRCTYRIRPHIVTDVRNDKPNAIADDPHGSATAVTRYHTTHTVIVAVHDAILPVSTAVPRGQNRTAISGRRPCALSIQSADVRGFAKGNRNRVHPPVTGFSVHKTTAGLGRGRQSVNGHRKRQPLPKRA